MEQIDIALLVGTFLSFIAPLGYSVWIETRFVQRVAAILYGLASISFGILYYHDVGYSQLGFWAIILFGIVGALFAIVGIIVKDFWDDEKSLVFSYKTIAGFQLSFLYISFLSPIFGNLPTLDNLQITNILIWGSLFTIVFHTTILPVRYYKN